jgi:hypothetical protein
MATYSAADLVGKTIFVTDRVPVYQYATMQGNKRPKPLYYLNAGDAFTVDSFVKQRGTYTTFDDNYYVGISQGRPVAISFRDIAGKYNTTAITNQGVKSEEQKKIEQQEKKDGVVLTTLKKFAPLALGAVVLIAIIGRRK